MKTAEDPYASMDKDLLKSIKNLRHQATDLITQNRMISEGVTDEHRYQK